MGAGAWCTTPLLYHQERYSWVYAKGRERKEHGKRVVCDKRDRDITCVFCRDLVLYKKICLKEVKVGEKLFQRKLLSRLSHKVCRLLSSYYTAHQGEISSRFSKTIRNHKISIETFWPYLPSQILDSVFREYPLGQSQENVPGAFWQIPPWQRRGSSRHSSISNEKS